jgi:hypothetical protein
MSLSIFELLKSISFSFTQRKTNTEVSIFNDDFEVKFIAKNTGNEEASSSKIEEINEPITKKKKYTRKITKC